MTEMLGKRSTSEQVIYPHGEPAVQLPWHGNVLVSSHEYCIGIDGI